MHVLRLLEKVPQYIHIGVSSCTKAKYKVYVPYPTRSVQAGCSSTCLIGREAVNH